MITGLTKGGTEWTPQFAIELDQSKCIGCGRCYKVCPRNVLDLVEREQIETGVVDNQFLHRHVHLHDTATALLAQTMAGTLDQDAARPGRVG